MNTDRNALPESANISVELTVEELKEENELLLSQLHLVQEELELNYRDKSEAGVKLTGCDHDRAWVDEELPAAIAENFRLQAIVEVQKTMHQVETQNALSVKLGDILIQGVESPSALLGVPGQLGRIWRASKRHTPPAVFGGKNFDRVIEVYHEAGFGAVDDLLTSVPVSPAMRANAHTALARALMQENLVNAATAARRAYELDPKPYRLKWLAFRLHEAGEVVEADAILDALPQNIHFSDSETRQVHKVRFEAKNVRLQKARQETEFVERRAQMDRQLNVLLQAREEQAQQVTGLESRVTHLLQAQVEAAATHDRQIERLETTKAQLELETSDLSARCNEQAELATQCREQVEQLQKAKVLLARENSALTVQQEEAAKRAVARREEIKSLKRALSQLEHEKSDLAGRHGVQERLASECDSRIERLRRAQAEMEADHNRQIKELTTARLQAEQERAAWAIRHDEQVRLTAEREEQIENLRQMQAALEAELGREIGELKSAKATLEQEKLELSDSRHELAELARGNETRIEQLLHAQSELKADYDRQIAELTAARLQLEREKSAVAIRHDEQAKLAAEREEQIEHQRQTQAALEAELGREIGELKSAKATLEQEKLELSDSRHELAELARGNETRIEQLLHAQSELKADYDRQIAELTAARLQLEQEKSAAAIRHDEQAKLAAEREEQIEHQRQMQAALEAELGREIGELKSAKATLEQEKLELSDSRHELAELARGNETRIEQLLHAQSELKADYDRQIAELTAARLQLEQEKSAVAIRHDEQAKLAAQRLQQLNELQPQIQNRLEAETELSKRQQLMQEELIRAEAQLDLIKDIILKEPEL